MSEADYKSFLKSAGKYRWIIDGAAREPYVRTGRKKYRLRKRDGIEAVAEIVRADGKLVEVCDLRVKDDVIERIRFMIEPPRFKTKEGKKVLDKAATRKSRSFHVEGLGRDKAWRFSPRDGARYCVIERASASDRTEAESLSAPSAGIAGSTGRGSETSVSDLIRKGWMRGFGKAPTADPVGNELDQLISGASSGNPFGPPMTASGAMEGEVRREDSGGSPRERSQGRAHPPQVTRKR